MKIITFYLPQFHSFPENNQWWGEGFTEWKNVKSAKPLFQEHQQPKIPLNNYYYDLLEVDVIRWQAKLAKKYGIYGFCYYHYWFDGKMLMNKPMEILLENNDIDLPYCISWANEDWTRAWAMKGREVLISQTYGGRKEWKEHFEYLLQFFNDGRYIKINGCPIFIIYRPELIRSLRAMLDYWQQLARENGYKKIIFMYQQVTYNHLKSENGDLFEYGIEYEPGYVKKEQIKTLRAVIKKILNKLSVLFCIKITKLSAMTYSYDDTWKRILKIKPRDEKMIPGAFVDWDNTPRYKDQATMMYGYSSAKFQKYLSEQIRRTKEVYKKDMLFLFAWNEWGEGGYLEPEVKEKYMRLEAVKKALQENGEL